jgi:putative ABC transport system ATP-binding protein
MTAAAILCRQLTKVYPGPEGSVEVRALGGIDLQIEKGERVAITGPSGCGKSSLLNILGTLDRPSSGQVEVYGQPIDSLQGRDRALYRRSTIGFIFQQYHLIPTLTALENVALPLHYAGIPSQEQEHRAAEALKRVGLGHRFGHLPSLLSGGEQQRAAVARALVTGARLLLADEPTGNLDGATARDIMKLLMENVGADLTLLVVTHNPELAGQLDRRIQVRDGLIEKDNF